MRRFFIIDLSRVVGALAAISWFALANHCALGLAMVDGHGAAIVAVDDCCASKIPSKPARGEKPAAPCCKTLRIVSVATTEAPTWTARPLFAIAHEEPGAALAPVSQAIDSFFLDSGPPPGRGALETLLRRSLPAHAPPVVS